MADPTAFYEPEEDELLSSLAVPSYQNGADQSYDENRRLQELEEHAYTEQMAAAHHEDQTVQLDLVPDDVKRVSSEEVYDRVGG